MIFFASAPSTFTKPRHGQLKTPIENRSKSRSKKTPLATANSVYRKNYAIQGGRRLSAEVVVVN